MENDRKGSRGDEEHYDLEILLRRPSLRTNIPRRISQVCREATPTKETTCGFGYLKGEWLQSFANKTSYIFIYGVLGSFYGSYYAYYYGAISSLEKRFKISSQTGGIIASTGDITMAITCFILSICIPKIHKPGLIGFGILLIIASTIIFALPHFLTQPNNLSITTRDYSSYLKNDTVVENCQNESFRDIFEKEHTHIILFLSQTIHGIGGALYFTAGKSYKDDNIEKYQPPALLSLLTVLTVLGPAFGYWLCSIFLKIFEYPNLMVHISDEEPQWLGAWWLGSLVIGFMLIIPGFLVTLFPKTLPKAMIKRIHNHLKDFADIKRDATEKIGGISTLKNFFFNPAFNSTHFGSLFNVMGFMSYFIYLPKYVETQYRISASKANLIAGSVILISSAGGIVIANSAITRYRPSARILASWTIIVGILSMGGFISYIYLGCEANDDETTAMINRNSNATCKCENSPFFPVCDEYSQSFTTPCHAGCENILYINYIQGYEICNYTHQSSQPRKVFTGFCPFDCYSEFVKFIIITSSITCIYATGRTCIYWFKTNSKNQKDLLALSSGMSFLGFLATIPAPIIFGFILDESCILWDGKYNRVGNCWLYDNKKLRLSINLTAIGYTIIGIIYDLYIWYSVKNLELFYDFDYYFDETDEK